MSEHRTTPTQQMPRFDLAGVHSLEVMAYVINRERARVERSGGCFTILIYDLHSCDLAEATLLTWASLRCKRITDEVGWYSQDTIALLLSDTDLRGAQVVAQRICKMVLVPLSYRIYQYPDQKKDETRPGDPPTAASSEPKARTGRCGEEAFEAQPLFVAKTPVWKRTIDVIGSLFGLLLTWPLFLLAALYIKAVSPGPVFHKQQRLGKGGRRFELLKFRSMKPGADASVHQQHLSSLLSSDIPMAKLDNTCDSRVIPLGNLLRWSSVDELPQLINVLRGEMSLVGPRPCLPYEAERYQLWQTRRFDVLPGITGLWQVSGKNRLTFKQMVRLDIRYGLSLSLLQDVRIILKTPITILRLLVEAVTARAGSSMVGQGSEKRTNRVTPSEPQPTP